jgi:YggT family protein
MGTLLAIIQIIQKLLSIVVFIIIVQAIFSWLIAFNVVNTRNQFVRKVWDFLDRITAPVYRPIRAILPDFGGIDFSPLVVILLIWVVQALLGGFALDIERSIYSQGL